MARVTVIIPTHNHGRLLLGAVRSLLRQTVQDFELFIIGDGVTAETREAIGQALALDPRIRFFDHPKSPRHGEPYRHEALIAAATGEIVCYLSDDDLWLPQHLESIRRALESAGMAHALPLWVNPDGSLSTTLIDLALPEWVQWTLAGGKKNSLSFVGHTMDFYRRLPHGWRTTPEGPTDHYMWAQMLSVPGMRAAGTGEYTVIGMPSILRKGWSPSRREEEMQVWENKILDDPGAIVREARRTIALSYYHFETGYQHLEKHIRKLEGREQRGTET